ncbi:NTP transferase domain-containing protein [Corynebacterium breve]|uniref:NTP transferase domain-containing protein n=1 Tax=Corynebacterium breve TaxID=3049799 RepID=A0ABY8VH17_9CORY|nr:NTP transferase domain-containing protein [Corynebacterium breve]WIM68622.1 NTP transferase domain-containing protein [Corynebacterium breve]
MSEDPPFGGPVAGIAAGVSRLSTDFVAVLSVDAPRSARLLPALYSAVESSTSDCAVVRSSDGFVQPLCALWRKTSLLAALDALGDPRDKSAKSLLRHAKSVAEIAGNGDERDYDTAAELSELGDVQL